MVNGILIFICALWLVPTLGVFVSSFRVPQDILTSGWWQIMPHKEDIQVDEINLPESVDVDGVMRVEGISATFEELREGVVLEDGRKLTWFGNKRTLRVLITEEQWVGFSTDLTLENYQNVLGGKSFTFIDGAGNEATRQGRGWERRSSIRSPWPFLLRSFRS